MKILSFAPPAAAAAVVALAFAAVTLAAQSPQQPAGGPPPQLARNFPPPTNLKVLPKNLTGAQVREVMEKWAGDLGVHCNTCHAEDPNHVGPNGRPRLNFADDSKPEKQTARLMYTMTEKINNDTISMVGDGKARATCGTCHRGHQKPEAFIPPPEEHHGPPPGAPADGKPPIPR